MKKQGCVSGHTHAHTWVCVSKRKAALGALKLMHAHPVFAAHCTWVRDPAVGYDFCQEDPKRPHVRFDGENSKVNGLRRRPFDGEFGTCPEEAKGNSTRRCSTSLCSHRHWQAVPRKLSPGSCGLLAVSGGCGGTWWWYCGVTEIRPEEGDCCLPPAFTERSFLPGISLPFLVLFPVQSRLFCLKRLFHMYILINIHRY